MTQSLVAGSEDKRTSACMNVCHNSRWAAPLLLLCGAAVVGANANVACARQRQAAGSDRQRRDDVERG